MTCGVPFPRGILASAEALTLAGANGESVPIQARVLDRWPDGSVRWALLDSRLDWSGAGANYRLGLPATSGATLAGVRHRLSVVDQAGDVLVDTGVVTFRSRAGGTFPFDRVTDANGRDLVDASRSGLRVQTGKGQACPVVVDSIDIEESGPVRTLLRWRGHVACGATTRWLEFEARGDVFVGLPVVRLRLTIRNPRPARHPGNFWELGDAGSVLLREAALVMALAGSGPISVECSAEPGSPMQPCGAALEIYQESSGGERWDSSTHVNREGRVPMRVRGYSIRTDYARDAGLRASPVATLSRGDTRLSATLPNFWQNFPRAIEVRDADLEIGLWPRQFPDAYELQGGEQKTHEVALAFGPDPVCEVPLDWCRTPALVRADPRWYCVSGVVAHLVPDAPDTPGAYRTLVRAAIDGEHTFTAKREWIDEYGWRNFGDIYADHEATRHRGGSPLVSHYNNQYDALAGFAVQFMRSGDPRWWTQMCELAAHVVDIDLYHTTDDKAAYAGGPFWHTSHYVDAGRSTHRSYPRAPGVAGGGPSCEHNHTGGLLLHYFLTGRRESRDAVVQLADWVLRIDDGARTPFRWLDRGDTGLASATRAPGHHGPGRGAANSIAALLDGHRVTGDVTYLEKAEQLIGRCIHPRDDLAACRLLDAEERWSYTIFLQVLGRYLEEFAEGGSPRPMFAYARESLLHYARWMAVHERPYLSTPERLEFPTETWAAADIRKCEVLLVASLYARDAAERATLRDQAAFFFRSSTETLLAMPSRTLARPVVIMLGNGYRMAWFDRHPEARAAGAGAAGPHDRGAPVPFVPQRQRAVRRAAWLAGTVAVAAAAALLTALF